MLIEVMVARVTFRTIGPFTCRFRKQCLSCEEKHVRVGLFPSESICESKILCIRGSHGELFSYCLEIVDAV